MYLLSKAASDPRKVRATSDAQKFLQARMDDTLTININAGSSASAPEKATAAITDAVVAFSSRGPNLATRLQQYFVYLRSANTRSTCSLIPEQ